MAESGTKADSPEPREPLGARLKADLRALGAAALYLTGAGSRAAPGDVARGGAFFPLLGLALGVPAAAVARLAPASLGPLEAGLALVAVMILLSRASLQRALARTVSNLATGSAPRPALARAAGLTAALAFTAGEIGAIALMPSAARPLAILLATMLSRWAFVVQAYGSVPANVEDQAPDLAPVFVREMKFREFGLASVTAMALTLLLADAVGLVLLLWVAAQTVTWRILVHRWAGGVDEPSMGAAAAFAELAILGWSATLARLLMAG